MKTTPPIRTKTGGIIFQPNPDKTSTGVVISWSEADHIADMRPHVFGLRCYYGLRDWFFIRSKHDTGYYTRDLYRPAWEVAS